jgi:hypothetical protein
MLKITEKKKRTEEAPYFLADFKSSFSKATTLILGAVAICIYYCLK